MIERNIEQIVEKGNQQWKKGDEVRKLIANLSPLRPLEWAKMVTAFIKIHNSCFPTMLKNIILKFPLLFLYH